MSVDAQGMSGRVVARKTADAEVKVRAKAGIEVGLLPPPPPPQVVLPSGGTRAEDGFLKSRRDEVDFRGSLKEDHRRAAKRVGAYLRKQEQRQRKQPHKEATPAGDPVALQAKVEQTKARAAAALKRSREALLLRNQQARVAKVRQKLFERSQQEAIRLRNLAAAAGPAKDASAPRLRDDAAIKRSLAAQLKEEALNNGRGHLPFKPPVPRQSVAGKGSKRKRHAGATTQRKASRKPPVPALGASRKLREPVSSSAPRAAKIGSASSSSFSSTKSTRSREEVQRFMRRQRELRKQKERERELQAVQAEQRRTERLQELERAAAASARATNATQSRSGSVSSGEASAPRRRARSPWDAQFATGPRAAANAGADGVAATQGMRPRRTLESVAAVLRKHNRVFLSSSVASHAISMAAEGDLAVNAHSDADDLSSESSRRSNSMEHQLLFQTMVLPKQALDDPTDSVLDQQAFLNHWKLKGTEEPKPLVSQPPQPLGAADQDQDQESVQSPSRQSQVGPDIESSTSARDRVEVETSNAAESDQDEQDHEELDSLPGVQRISEAVERSSSPSPQACVDTADASASGISDDDDAESSARSVASSAVSPDTLLERSGSKHQQAEVDAVQMLKEDADRIAADIMQQALERDPLLQQQIRGDLRPASPIAMPPGFPAWTRAENGGKKSKKSVALERYLQRQTFGIVDLFASQQGERRKRLSHEALQADATDVEEDLVGRRNADSEDEPMQVAEQDDETGMAPAVISPSRDVSKPEVQNDKSNEESDASEYEDDYEVDEDMKSADLNEMLLNGSHNNLAPLSDTEDDQDGQEPPERLDHDAGARKWDKVFLEVPSEDHRPVLNTSTMEEEASTPAMAATRERLLSPGSLRRKLLAHVNLLETLEQTHMQLNELEHTQALSLAQHETVSLMQKWEDEKRQAAEVARMATLQKASDDFIKQQTERIRHETTARAESLVEASKAEAALLNEELARSRLRETAAQTQEKAIHDTGTDPPPAKETHSVSVAVEAPAPAVTCRATSPLPASHTASVEQQTSTEFPIEHTSPLARGKTKYVQGDDDDDDDDEDYSDEFDQSMLSSPRAKGRGGEDEIEEEENASACDEDDEQDDRQDEAAQQGDEVDTSMDAGSSSSAVELAEEEEDADADDHYSSFVDDTSIQERNAEFLNVHDSTLSDQRLVREVIPDDSLLRDPVSDGENNNLDLSFGESVDESAGARPSFREFTRELLVNYRKNAEVRRKHEDELLKMRERALRDKTREQLKWLIHQKRLMSQWLADRKSQSSGSGSHHSVDTKMPSQEDIEVSLRTERKKIESAFRMKQASIDSERAALNERFYREELHYRKQRQMFQRMEKETEALRAQRKTGRLSDFDEKRNESLLAASIEALKIKGAARGEELFSPPSDMSTSLHLLEHASRDLSLGIGAVDDRGLSPKHEVKPTSPAGTEEVYTEIEDESSQGDDDESIPSQVQEEKEDVEDGKSLDPEEVEEEEDDASVDGAAESMVSAPASAVKSRSSVKSGSDYYDETFEDDVDLASPSHGPGSNAGTRIESAELSMSGQDVAIQESMELRQTKIASLTEVLDAKRGELAHLQKKKSLRESHHDQKVLEAELATAIDRADAEIQALRDELAGGKPVALPKQSPTCLPVKEDDAIPVPEDWADQEDASGVGSELDEAAFALLSPGQEEEGEADSQGGGLLTSARSSTNDAHEHQRAELVQSLNQDSFGSEPLSAVVREEGSEVGALVATMASDSFMSEDEGDVPAEELAKKQTEQQLALEKGVEDDRDEDVMDQQEEGQQRDVGCVGSALRDESDKAKLAEEITAMLMPELLEQAVGTAGEGAHGANQGASLADQAKEAAQQRYQQSESEPEHEEEEDHMRSDDDEELDFFDWTGYNVQYIRRVFRMIESLGGIDLLKEWKKDVSADQGNAAVDVLPVEVFLDLAKEFDGDNTEFLHINNKMLFDMVNTSLRELLIGRGPQGGDEARSVGSDEGSEHGDGGRVVQGHPWAQTSFQRALRTQMPLVMSLQEIETQVLQRVLRWDSLERGPSVIPLLEGKSTEHTGWTLDAYERMENVVCMDMNEMEREWLRYDQEEWDIVSSVADMLLEDLVGETASHMHRHFETNKSR
ncbi:Centrosome-associated protein 350 (Cep350) [Durusdinium trenchii]|uniref:Centrosome-associated protein 350 (Cep350) n=1 Tax=Durusdinium trenchii TaxID=1381693 RepID=A0ABP0QVU6_9DINO